MQSRAARWLGQSRPERVDRRTDCCPALDASFAGTNAEHPPEHLRSAARFIKKRIHASQGFRSVQGALSTIQGYEAMHMIPKGQIRWLKKGDVAGQIHFVNRAFGVAA